MKYEHFLLSNISKSLLKDQDLSIGNAGGIKNCAGVFSKIYGAYPKGMPNIYFLHFWDFSFRPLKSNDIYPLRNVD